MSVATLTVWLDHVRVGELERDANGRLTFRYDREWLGAAEAFAVSVSLPLREEPYVGGTFFANLLPEAGARERVCRKLGISIDNDFALLTAIGGECAGALSVLPSAAHPGEHGGYRKMSARELHALTTPGGVVPLLAGGARTRLSLAGAQDKLPVLLELDDVYLPLEHAPSTHILKLGNPDYTHVLANEALMLRFGAELGLDVVDASLRKLGAASALFAQRYDRVWTDDVWSARRVHQEDMCQALARRPTEKYESEGGPSLTECVRVLRDYSRSPLVDVQRLLRWVVFNLISGNADAHAKNLSLVYQERGRPPILAPFYDLVCTRAYRQLDRRMAMSIGGESDPGQIGLRHWEAFAAALSIGTRALLGIVGDLLDEAKPALERSVAAFREQHGDHPAIAMVVPVVKRQLRRTQTLFRSTQSAVPAKRNARKKR